MCQTGDIRNEEAAAQPEGEPYRRPIRATANFPRSLAASLIAGRADLDNLAPADHIAKRVVTINHAQPSLEVWLKALVQNSISSGRALVFQIAD